MDSFESVLIVSTEHIMLTLVSPGCGPGHINIPERSTCYLMKPSVTFGTLSVSILVLVTKVIDPIFLDWHATIDSLGVSEGVIL